MLWQWKSRYWGQRLGWEVFREEGRGERGSGGDKWPPQCGVEAMGEATVRKSPWLLCPLMHRALLIPFHDDVILRILRAPVILFSANVLHPQFSTPPTSAPASGWAGMVRVNAPSTGDSGDLLLLQYLRSPHSLPQCRNSSSSSCLQWTQSLLVAHHTVVVAHHTVVT